MKSYLKISRKFMTSRRSGSARSPCFVTVYHHGWDWNIIFSPHRWKQHPVETSKRKSYLSQCVACALGVKIGLLGYTGGFATVVLDLKRPLSSVAVRVLVVHIFERKANGYPRLRKCQKSVTPPTLNHITYCLITQMSGLSVIIKGSGGQPEVMWIARLPQSLLIWRGSDVFPR